MPLSKDKMRKYQKERRKSGNVNHVNPTVNLPSPGVESVNPCKPICKPDVTREEFTALQAEVETLKSRLSALERRKPGVTMAVSTQRVPGKADPGLFSRVMAEKERRLGG